MRPPQSETNDCIIALGRYSVYVPLDGRIQSFQVIFSLKNKSTIIALFIFNFGAFDK